MITVLLSSSRKSSKSRKKPEFIEFTLKQITQKSKIKENSVTKEEATE
jgi:hypothetical protein